MIPNATKVKEGTYTMKFGTPDALLFCDPGEMGLPSSMLKNHSIQFTSIVMSYMITDVVDQCIPIFPVISYLNLNVLKTQVIFYLLFLSMVHYILLWTSDSVSCVEIIYWKYFLQCHSSDDFSMPSTI